MSRYFGTWLPVGVVLVVLFGVAIFLHSSSTQNTNVDSTNVDKKTIVRQYLSALLFRKLLKASDQAVIDYAELFIDQVDELQSQGGDLCFKFTSSLTVEGMDGVEVFPKELQKREMALLDLALKTYDENRRIPSEEEIASYFEQVLASLFEIYGEDTMYALFLEDEGGEVDREKGCSIARDMYSKTLTIDPEQSVSLLRYLISGYTPETP